MKNGKTGYAPELLTFIAVSTVGVESVVTQTDMFMADSSAMCVFYTRLGFPG